MLYTSFFVNIEFFFLWVCVGAETTKFSYDHCFHLCVEGEYGSRECFVDCTQKGFWHGVCANKTTAKDPIHCCCYN